jgi:hypothetical protein
MGITRVQQPTNTAASGTTLSCSWSQATVAGNTLFALLGHDASPGAYTPPAGWTQLGTTINNGSACNGSLWAYFNAPSRSGSESWSFANTVALSSIILAEYSGIASQDGSNQTNTGTSSSPTTASLTTTYANDLLLGVLLQTNQGTNPATSFSAPTNSFTLVTQQNNKSGSVAQIDVGLLERIVAATGTYSSGVTSSSSGAWASILAAFSGYPNPPRPWRRQPRVPPKEPRDLYTW